MFTTFIPSSYGIFVKRLVTSRIETGITSLGSLVFFFYKVNEVRCMFEIRLPSLCYCVKNLSTKKDIFSVEPSHPDTLVFLLV